MANTDPHTPDTRTDRDQSGRFVKGGPGGPGNPFARRTAALRQAFGDAVTPDDLKTLAKGLLIQAHMGDVAAAKLVLAYAIGKPVDPVNPDTLDIQEMQLYNQVPTRQQDVHRILNSLPAGLACELIRILLPNTELQIKSLWWKKMQGDLKKEERRDKRKAARAARSSPVEGTSEPAAHMAPTEDSSEPAAQARVRPNPVAHMAPTEDSSEPAAQARVRPKSAAPKNEIAPQSCSQSPSPKGTNGKAASNDSLPHPPSANSANPKAPTNNDGPDDQPKVRNRQKRPAPRASRTPRSATNGATPRNEEQEARPGASPGDAMATGR